MRRWFSPTRPARGTPRAGFPPVPGRRFIFFRRSRGQTHQRASISGGDINWCLFTTLEDRQLGSHKRCIHTRRSAAGQVSWPNLRADARARHSVGVASALFPYPSQARPAAPISNRRIVRGVRTEGNTEPRSTRSAGVAQSRHSRRSADSGGVGGEVTPQKQAAVGWWRYRRPRYVSRRIHAPPMLDRRQGSQHHESPEARRKPAAGRLQKFQACCCIFWRRAALTAGARCPPSDLVHLVCAVNDHCDHHNREKQKPNPHGRSQLHAGAGVTGASFAFRSKA